MVSKKVKIKNATGLHLRPAGLLCEISMKYSSKVTFHTDNNYEANAKSVLSVLGACVKTGEEIEVFCDGIDETEALDDIVNSIEAGLGE
ncbi:HPr family phosphocarrier protein [Pseudobutyrivibrio xylanivorans]|uniref:HPr family phosphocarrier protein n=1 Tax=Pseudobutyrivibrio xylanivorans TaxID=185007 RepID=A0A5P6VMW2_PSEXY|nr:HPr family phosphocarrier protein [Pseudobutyrivibrio xylanivorans]QFJ53995.1 HPr family phosphocarrier protein [Pseudobutyrivibrio xylanivorans]